METTLRPLRPDERELLWRAMVRFGRLGGAAHQWCPAQGPTGRYPLTREERAYIGGALKEYMVEYGAGRREFGRRQALIDLAHSLLRGELHILLPPFYQPRARRTRDRAAMLAHLLSAELVLLPVANLHPTIGRNDPRWKAGLI